MRSALSYQGIRQFALILALLGTGCSYFFIRPVPPNPPPQQAYVCNSSRLWPVIDGLMVLSLATGGTITVDDEGNDVPPAVQVPVTLATAAAFGLSAYHGYIHTERCHQAKMQYYQQYGPFYPGAQPQPYPPQPQPYPPQPQPQPYPRLF